MNLLDIVLGITLAVGIVSGIKDGFARQLAGFAGLVAGILLGKRWYMPVSEKLGPLLGCSEKTTQIVSFILILVLVPLCLAFLARLLSKWLSSVGLGGFNRLLGAFFGVLKYALFAGILIAAVESFDPEGHLVSLESRRESVLYEPVHTASDVFFKSVKQQIAERSEALPDGKSSADGRADDAGTDGASGGEDSGSGNVGKE